MNQQSVDCCRRVLLVATALSLVEEEVVEASAVVVVGTSRRLQQSILAVMRWSVITKYAICTSILHDVLAADCKDLHSPNIAWLLPV